MDGVVIGGPGHGQTRDPEKTGPVLLFPKFMRATARYVSADLDPMATEPIAERVQYRLHVFHSTDGTERFRYRVWLPDDVKSHQAFEFLISTALKAPKSELEI